MHPGWGGARRKPATQAAQPTGEVSPAAAPAEPETLTPLEFLERTMNDPSTPLKDRIRAAVAAAQYRHAKRGESGKKEDAAGRAKKAGEGRFSSSAPPRLVAAGGKRTG